MILTPSDVLWVESIADRLLDGDILMLRGLPRTGKTILSSAIVELLGPSALLVSGKGFTEETQHSRRQELEKKIHNVVETQNCAQLIFDDYGHAIRRSQGGALHSALYHLLVDDEIARDIGALLTCRYNDNIDYRFSGSPLLSRAHIVQVPMLAELDATLLGMPLAQLRAAVGCTTSLARRFGPVDSSVRTYELAEYLAADRRAIAEDLPPHAVEVIVGARPYNKADAISQNALLTVGHVADDGSFMVAEAVREAGLPGELELRNPGWPDGSAASVEAFVDMLSGSDDALWIDRYLLADVGRLQSFLRRVRAHTNCRLRLLSSDDWDAGGACVREARSLGAIENVEIRLMKPADRRSLHDRHLVLPRLRNVFVLPTAGVILGRDAPGTAVAVRIPSLPVDYSYFWRRANQLETQ